MGKRGDLKPICKKNHGNMSVKNHESVVWGKESVFQVFFTITKFVTKSVTKVITKFGDSLNSPHKVVRHYS